jgi:hypothetical protein
MGYPDNEALAFSAEEAQACRAEIESVCGSPLPSLEPHDTYKLWASNRESAAYTRLRDKLNLLRYRRLVVVVHEIRYDGSILEVRLYMDAWIELFDDYGYGLHCFKSYHHGPTTV